MATRILGIALVLASISFTFKIYAGDCGSFGDILLCKNKSSTLNECDKKIISAYTLGLYIPLNEHLRNITPDSDCTPLVTRLNESLSKLKSIGQKTLYRGITFIKPLKNLKSGECFVDPSFMSTSKKRDGALDFIRYELEAILMVINTASGKSISKFSENPDEEEVLMMPGTVLKITKIEKTNKQFSTFYFEEVSKAACPNL